MEINLRTGELYHEGNKYYLTQYEMKALNRLKAPGIVTYEEIYEALYNMKVRKLEISDRCRISTIISRLKKKTGLMITSHVGYGYELMQ